MLAKLATILSPEVKLKSALICPTTNYLLLPLSNQLISYICHMQENEFVSSLHEGGGMVWVGAARMHGAKSGAWVWDDLSVKVNFTNWEEEVGVGSNEEEKDDEGPGGGKF